MQSLKLAYRDVDRLPVIFAIREMAKRHYDLDVHVVRIHPEPEFEESLFNGASDVLIEHLEFLYERVKHGSKVTFFCAPSKGGGLHLVVPPQVQSLDDFKGGKMAVRTSGQPYAVKLWLRSVGLDKEVETVMVSDGEIGRWGQWKKIVAGECIATFMSPLYLPAALAAGLKILPASEIPIVGQFAQACRADFPIENPELMQRYVKSVLHALAWLIRRREEAFAALGAGLKAGMKLNDDAEFKRRFDAVVAGIKIRPYPTPEAVANTYECAALEYDCKGLNPLSLWDLHWVKQLDDEGFIDALPS